MFPHSEVEPFGVPPGMRFRSTDPPDSAHRMVTLRSETSPHGGHEGRVRSSDPPGTESGVLGIRFTHDAGMSHGVHIETSVERSVRRTLHRIYFVSGIVVALCCLLLFLAGLGIYYRITYVDPVKPDYSALDTESDTYWTDRIQIDMETALQSDGTDQIRMDRLRTFANRTVADAMMISESYTRAQAVTRVVMTLAQHDINLLFDSQLRRLGETSLVASMRARTLISQGLMHLRKGRNPSAQLTLQQYNQLVSDFDLKMNSSINEESFFGAVTILHYLGDKEGLIEQFARQKASTSAIGMDQRMKAYRLIAGEQVRTGMVMEALETAKQISNPVELARAWTLILQYAARPPRVIPVEPVMLDLLENPQEQPPEFIAYAEQVANRIFQYLAENKDINTQTSLLQRIAGSRLMCDVELQKTFRQCLVASTEIQDRVKQPVLKLLDDPESPTIREAHNLPPRGNSEVAQIDSTQDDWTTSDEVILVEVVNVDSTPLRTRLDLQWIRALLAAAQSYQSIKRFQDADRYLKQAFDGAQRFVEPSARSQLLLRIGERQVAIGSIAGAQKTFESVAPSLSQRQKEGLARIQIIARLYNDAFQTISSIESPAQREYVCSLLVQEQIRLNRLHDAEKTLLLMPAGNAQAESQSRLNFAKGEATGDDFDTLGLVMPEGNDLDWERYCLGLIQHGCLRSADQATNGIGSVRGRTDALVSVAREYQLLYQALNDTNDPGRAVRQEILPAIASAAERSGQPIFQTKILTEFLVYHTGQLRNEADVREGKRLLSLAMDACRKIEKSDDKAVWFAQLIVAKNMLEKPNPLKKTAPFFTKETNPQAFTETNNLVNECLEFVNLQDSEEKQGMACVHLAEALVQIGRTNAAQSLLNRILDIASNASGREASIPLFLSMIPALKAMNSADTIPTIYRLAINEIINEYSGGIANIDIYRWRVRDSEIEQIVRSQLENGFVDDAVESANRINEPVHRDQLLRTAAYMYFDQGNTERAELEARRMMGKELQDTTIQNIQILKRRMSSNF